MKLGGIIIAATDILNEFFKTKQAINIIIKLWSKNNRYAGSNDRHQISNIIYNLLRSYYSFQFMAKSEKLEELLLISILCGKQALTYDKVKEELTNDKYAKDLLKYLPTNIEDVVHFGTNIEDITANIEIWQKPYFIKTFGENWVQEAYNLSLKASIDIRINQLKAPSKLDLVNFIAIDVNFPNALRLEENSRLHKKQKLTALEEYKKGYFEIQNFGSQYIAALVHAQPNMQILDYCAGAGGKSLAMADNMQNKGKIFAYDKYQHRLLPIKERIMRSGADIICPINDVKKLSPNMDMVIVDAPCSGSGTWRRTPDQKFLLQENDLKNIVKNQAQILQKASAYVKVNGYLCYMTCSLFSIENDAQIHNFLTKNSNFTLDVTKINRLSYSRYHNKYGISLTPFKSNCDGFYFAALQRIY